ncbi:mechanosensitive ion channel family protein [Peristeroidobacter soli]|jgi:small-conductance mechanosensitive channel|uniref:mechanosensitive ion channel family protein n=1 Tax=Peristeroidobacter soli TaxID=2497877 RepID=UPI00101BF04E|nr:mechanosensitive ion channel family protein [Peristeroidobacter soli]
MKELWPSWGREWLGEIVPVFQVLLILLVALLLQRLARRVIRRLGEHNVPPEILTIGRRLSGFLIYGAALLLILERVGVSASVLWAALTGFAAVAAVAFFAVWSVLSNIFCSVLIFTTRPFRLYDRIEVLENGEKAGLKGRVVDINLIYTTLQEEGTAEGEPGPTLQIPNSLFFQRAVRRFRPGG